MRQLQMGTVGLHDLSSHRAAPRLKITSKCLCSDLSDVSSGRSLFPRSC